MAEESDGRRRTLGDNDSHRKVHQVSRLDQSLEDR